MRGLLKIDHTVFGEQNEVVRERESGQVNFTGMIPDMQDAGRMRVAAVFIMCRSYFTEVIVVNPDIGHVDTFCGFGKADHADAAVAFVEHVAGGDDISERLCLIFQRAGSAELYGKSTFPTAIEIVVIIS